MTKTLSSSLENLMNLTRILTSVAGAALACAVLAAPAANAQTTTASTLTVNTTVAAKPTATSTQEALTVSGTLNVTGEAIINPAGGPTTMVYYIDGYDTLNITGASGRYRHTCQANITRQLTATGADTVVFTFPVISSTGQARTVSGTAKFQVNTTTLQVTSATVSLAYL